MSKTVSVALCTMNCAPYLGAQLDSVRRQTSPPDELIVGDEASSDGTRDILRAFAKDAPFPVRILYNEVRLGVAANFSQVLGACTGDLIALCDHDDVWEATRIAAAVRAFEDPQVSLSFSDASLLDANGNQLPGRLWATLGLDSALQRRLRSPDAFRIQLGRRLVTGGTMTLRRDVAQWALPIPLGFYQDEWLAILAALRGRLEPIPDALMRYRQHPANAVGAVRDGWTSRVRRVFDGRRAERLRVQLAQLRILHAELPKKGGVPASGFEALASRIAHVEARLAVDGGLVRRSAQVAKELSSGRYRDDAFGHWSAAQDLVG